MNVVGGGEGGLVESKIKHSTYRLADYSPGLSHGSGTLNRGNALAIRIMRHLMTNGNTCSPTV